ncbi:MAG TPA: TlpA disulfide reductase family protein [Flavobacterium sp.]|jgi:thiol-disulfide isomerase/thioredoxin
MKNIIFIIAAVVAVSCSNAQTNLKEEALSQELTALDGSKIAFGDVLKKYHGKPLMIEVWASWCGDCVKAMPKLKETQAANPHVQYLFLSMDRAEDKWKSGIEKHALKGDHYWAVEGMKGPFGKAIDLDWIPRYIIIDKTGKVVVYRAIETDFEKINQTLKSMNP